MAKIKVACFFLGHGVYVLDMTNCLQGYCCQFSRDKVLMLSHVVTKYSIHQHYHRHWHHYHHHYHHQSKPAHFLCHK